MFDITPPLIKVKGIRNLFLAMRKKKKKVALILLKSDAHALYCGAIPYKRNQATDCLNSRILWSPSAEQNKEVNCLEGGKLIMVVGLLPCIQKIGWHVKYKHLKFFRVTGGAYL